MTDTEKRPGRPRRDGPKPPTADAEGSAGETAAKTTAKEIGGRGGPDPTRFGDWEKNGRCVDF